MNTNAPRDDNAVPTALFAISTSPSFVAPGQIDELTGRILVDVSGGGGGGGSTLNMEIPSGTVNGVNKIFTVQNTPVFIDTSGQVNVSSTQDATNFGYTFSSGTVTFTFAPTQTPHSFYNSAAGSATLASFFEEDQFTSTLNQTVFTTTLVPTFVLSFVVNGQPQNAGTDYTQSGAVFTLASGIPAGLPVFITYLHS